MRSAVFAAMLKVLMKSPDARRQSTTDWRLPVVHDRDLGLHPRRYQEDQAIGFWHLYIQSRLELPEAHRECSWIEMTALWKYRQGREFIGGRF